MAFLKKFDIKQICVVNHQEINILSNFGSRKTKNREMIGSSVKDFGSFYQKTLEPIFSKDRKTTALIEVDHNGEPNAIIDLKKISVEQEQRLLKAFSIKSVPFRIVFYRSNFNGLFLGEGIQDALEDEQIDVLASFERLLDGIRLNCKIFGPKPQKWFDR